MAVVVEIIPVEASKIDVVSLPFTLPITPLGSYFSLDYRSSLPIV